MKMLSQTEGNFVAGGAGRMVKLELLRSEIARAVTVATALKMETKWKI